MKTSDSSGFPVAGNSNVANQSRIRRRSIYAKTKGRCFYCGVVLRLNRESFDRDWLLTNHSGRMVIEHVIPTVRGGEDKIENFVPACSPCNHEKSALTGEEFRFLRRLKVRDFQFVFFADPAPIKRDWIVCHSGIYHRALLMANFPSSRKAYARGRPGAIAS